MRETRWQLKAADESAVLAVVDATALPRPIARAAVMRGHQDPAEIATYLTPRLSALSDPFRLPDMQPAVCRIWQAIDDGERIAIFGDYDVDGVTSAALLTRFLRAMGAGVEAFIPDRLDEGYGLSPEALERCRKLHHPDVIITVDCGTNSVESVAAAQDVDIIITDHHEPASETANALALINPKLGSHPELNTLSGVGVAFKLAHAIVKQGRSDGRAAAAQIDLKTYLDIVALGTVADLVPLVGENRILVYSGLVQLNQTGWAGMQALKTVAGIRGDADTYSLGFQLGPRINAAGRIGQPEQALRLLTTDDAHEAQQIADRLNRTNLERRRMEQQMTDQAFEEIDGYFASDRHYGLVVAREGWHPGVVGIVASRVVRHYNRPAIILGIDEAGRVRGSCRSTAGFDLLAGLADCSSLLKKHGGHKMAAGLELAVENLDKFRTAFNAAAAAVLGPLDLTPVQSIDAEVLPSELNWNFFEQQSRLQPFGQDNPEPVWMLSNLRVIGEPRVVGNDHLKFQIEADGQRFDAIAFSFPAADFPAGRIDAAFTLKLNEWNGNRNLQLQIKAVRAADPA